MTDISTVETVTCGGYEVRVGQHQGGYAALVVGDDSIEIQEMDQAHPLARVGFGFSVGGGDGASSDAPGPVTTAPHKWVAVGLAVEAFEWDDTPGADVEVDAAAEYAAATVDGEALAEALTDD